MSLGFEKLTSRKRLKKCKRTCLSIMYNYEEAMEPGKYLVVIGVGRDLNDGGSILFLQKTILAHFVARAPVSVFARCCPPMEGFLLRTTPCNRYMSPMSCSTIRIRVRIAITSTSNTDSRNPKCLTPLSAISPYPTLRANL